jgi:hypothetical protein
MASIAMGPSGKRGRDGMSTAVRDTYRLLRSRDALVRFRIFDGGHDWPPSQVLVEAVEWMEWVAAKDNAAWRTSRLEAATALDPVEACFEYEALARELKDSELEARAKECLKSKPVRESVRRLDDELTRERGIYRELQEADEFRQRGLLTGLKKAAARTEDSGERRTARRVLGGTFVGHIEAARSAADVDRARAIRHLEMALFIRPDAAWLEAEVAKLKGR